MHLVLDWNILIPTVEEADGVDRTGVAGPTAGISHAMPPGRSGIWTADVLLVQHVTKRM